MSFNAGQHEAGIYLISGSVALGEQEFTAPILLAFDEGDGIEITAAADAKCLFLGGERMPEKRHIYWNFVSSSRDKIEEAKQRWREQRFPPVPDETDWIPLPGETKDGRPADGEQSQMP